MHLTGTVTLFDPDELFAFVQPDGWIKEILVRRETLADAGYPPLAEGDRVKIQVVRNDRHILVAKAIETLAGNS